jgi:hypothetical protein
MNSQPETAGEPAIISRSDGGTQAQIGAVFFRLRMRLRLVNSNHAGLKGRLHIVILAFVVLYRS